jgi:hypothetical protein
MYYRHKLLDLILWRVAQSRPDLQPPAHAGSSLADFSTLKIEATLSSETSVHTRFTRRHIQEDGIPQVIKMIGKQRHSSQQGILYAYKIQIVEITH